MGNQILVHEGYVLGFSNLGQPNQEENGQEQVQLSVVGPDDAKVIQESPYLRGFSVLSWN